MKALQLLGNRQVNLQDQRHEGQWHQGQRSLWNDAVSPAAPNLVTMALQ